MTDRIGSSRRLIVMGAALLAAAAVALVLGVVPPVRSDISSQAAPGSASVAFMVLAGIAVFLALALGLVAVRAVHRPHASISVLYVIGPLLFLLGVALAVLAPAFLEHGPSLHGAVLFMFLSAAAVFAATGLVVTAASRLPGPATSGDTSAWRMRIAPAALLGIGSFFVMVLLVEVIKLPPTVPAAEYVGGFLLAVALGGYSLIATYVISRGLPRARRNLWIVLAMNAALLLGSLIALLAEPNKSVALQLLGTAIISIACSYGGLALAARTTRPPAALDEPANH